MKNKVKERINTGGVAIGTITGITDPQLIEAVCLTGVIDFITFDLEHGPMTTETCENLIRIANLAEVTPFVRPLKKDGRAILPFIDAGAQGCQVPLVETAEDVQEIQSGMLYPPLGNRGLAMVRSAQFGIGKPIAEYVRIANQEMILIAQIETQQAIQNIDELVNYPEIDIYYIGPVDLSLSYGHPGNPNHPDVVRAIATAETSFLQAGKVLGTIARNADQATSLIKRGYQFLAVPLTSFILQAVKDFAQDIDQ
jgi:4-hydroxy-2-oxoheptanedioate aldolase